MSINDAVFEGLQDEFKSEPQYEFTMDNNPIVCSINGLESLQIRVNTMQNVIEIWKKQRESSEDAWFSASTYVPFRKFPLESPDCFNKVFDLIREGT
jgi:hypothetical protein